MVIEALRNELQQYGEMLALLDQQRQLAPKSGADEILHSISAINAQGASIQAAREQRQRAQQKLANVLQRAQDATFSDLIPLLPDSYQPLVSALVQENNDLLGQVRERAQENQHLLRRSLELMQRFIITLAGNEQKAQNAPHETTVLPLEPSSSLYAALV
jgi:RecA/RadA recombinase